MRLTVTVDERRGTVRVEAERALDYQPGHVRRIGAAAAQRVVDQLRCQQPVPVVAATVLAGAGEPAQPRDRHDQPPTLRCPELGTGRRVEITRGRVLRMLDRGATVEAADRFGIAPEQIDRWDDDAAADGRADLIAAGPGRWSP